MADRLRLWWHQWPRALARVLLPSQCALCGGSGADVVCMACQAQYLGTGVVRCPCCANPLPAGSGPAALCGGCIAQQPSFEATIVAAEYALPLDQLVLQLKFGARLQLAPWFATVLRDAVLARPDLPLPDLICPVPLGPGRLVERGFNQSLEIARPLSRTLGVRLAPRLVDRVLETRAQSGVTPGERKANIRGAFEVAADVAGLHVGVVDDVMTSGSTLDELAATLKRAGAARVTNYVFARTPPH